MFLERALADIGGQTFTDVVVAVVNDGGDPAGVDAAVAALPEGLRAKVTVLHNSTSTGMEAASNRGLRATASEFCCIHDDDDLWAPTFLERTVAFLDADPAARMVCTRIEIQFERACPDGSFEVYGRKPFWRHIPRISVMDLLVMNRVVPIGICYRRSLHDDIGYYDESLPVVGDWEFNLRVSTRYPIGLIDEVLAYWRQRPDTTGPAANSVFGNHEQHGASDLAVRDAAIRDHVAGGAHVAPYLYQAHLAREADRRAEHLERRIEDLFVLVEQRTSPTWWVRRVVGRLRRR